MSIMSITSIIQLPPHAIFALLRSHSRATGEFPASRSWAWGFIIVGLWLVIVNGCGATISLCCRTCPTRRFERLLCHIVIKNSRAKPSRDPDVPVIPDQELKTYGIDRMHGGAEVVRGIKHSRSAR